MATLWIGSRRTEFDTTGALAASAKAYFYDAETTTPRTVYSDNALSTPHTFPLLADASGRWPAVFLPDGLCKVRVTTAADVVLYEDDGIDGTAVVAFDGGDVTELTTGDTVWSLQTGVRGGWVRMNARTIGSAASSASERANADTATLFAFLWNNLSDTSCPVSGGRGASAAADFAANKTIGLPDLRGRVPGGIDDMGGASAGRWVGSTFIVGNGTTVGSSLGANVHTLTLAESAAHDHGGATGSAGDHNHGGATGAAGAHEHNYTRYNEQLTVDADDGGGAITGVNRNNTTVATTGGPGDHTHTIAASGHHTHTIASAGGGSAHNNVQPTMLGSWYIRL